MLGGWGGGVVGGEKRKGREEDEGELGGQVERGQGGALVRCGGGVGGQGQAGARTRTHEKNGWVG